MCVSVCVCVCVLNTVFLKTKKYDVKNSEDVSFDNSIWNQNFKDEYFSELD